MKQVYIRKAYDLVVEEVKDIVPKKGEAVVKVEACGICGTDVHSYEGKAIFPKYPFHPGHEVAGTIYSLAEHSDKYNVGEKVIIDPLYPCEECEFCRVNKQNHCLNNKTIGIVGPGGFSDYIVVPIKNLYKFYNIDFTEATFAEPLSTVIYGIEKVEIGYGDKVLIQGAGPIGLLHLQMSIISGSSMVVMTDLNLEKIKKAEKMGANKALLASDPKLEEQLFKYAPYGYDVVIDCTGSSIAVEKAFKFIKNTGSLLVFGVCPQDDKITINPYEIFRREIKIVGSFALKKTMAKAVKLLDHRVINAKDLIADIVARREVEPSLINIKEGGVNGKIIVIPRD